MIHPSIFKYNLFFLSFLQLKINLLGNIQINGPAVLGKSPKPIWLINHEHFLQLLHVFQTEKKKNQHISEIIDLICGKIKKNYFRSNKLTSSLCDKVNLVTKSCQEVQLE